MPTFPAKTNYAAGDVLTAAQMVDVGNGLNDLLPDAKGSLTTVSAANTPAQLTVGANGETLVADSSQTTGLRWGNNFGFTAGKNKIINGDFAINQRNFTSITTTAVYGFDRWISAYNDGTNTMTPQTFTAGTAPVAGYEAINYVRLESSGQTAAASLSAVVQRVEDVRTFAGQTITVSFWAKASTGTPNIVAYAQQAFGSGGSTSVNIGSTSGKKAISASWARYSFVIPVQSISGKTIGSGSYLAILLAQSAGSSRDSYTDSLGIQSVTIDYWGVQAEVGSVATAFQTATGTLAGELAACQRYLPVLNATSSNAQITGYSPATNTWNGTVFFPVTARVKPTGITVSTPVGTYFSFRDNTNTLQTVTAITYDNASLNSCNFLATTTSTQGTAGRLILADGTILFTGCEL